MWGEKSVVYVVTVVDRASRCIVAWQVMSERTTATMQTVIDAAPPASRSDSDLFPTYPTLVYYPGQHRACPDKSQTYSVEADNAELRHYLARLAHKSRCFSRCLQALRRAIKLFAFAWNRRQLYKRAHPKYPAHVSDFISP